MALLLGFDIGSSFVKASLLDAETGREFARDSSPRTEMEITSRLPGWAEQHPDLWWENVKSASAGIKNRFNFNPAEVKAVGISYQMHGLVLVNRRKLPLRPAIIWCDSRAVGEGEKIQSGMGRNACFREMLNLPGNFTASKLMWVKANEPEIYRKVYRMMLPGDYIAMKMTGEINTTPSGLSEGVMWDYRKRKVSEAVLASCGFSPDIIPAPVPAFSVQGKLRAEAADELGLSRNTAVSYRSGDQPNNAFALNVLEPGEICAGAGTSGVIYAVTDKMVCDRKSRVNSFVHVNDSPGKRRNGILLCINGTGILYSWLRRHFYRGADYNKMNCLAREVPVGAGGVSVLPFGNGAERTLGNRDIGAFFGGIRFNSHDERHLLRAAQEGVVFSMNSGLDIMRGMKIECSTVKACRSNMFLSNLFCEAFVNSTGTNLKLYSTDGAQGAARGAGIGAGIYKGFDEAFESLELKETFDPDKRLTALYRDAYIKWMDMLGPLAGAGGPGSKKKR